MNSLDFHKELYQILQSEPNGSFTIDSQYIEITQSTLIEEFCSKNQIETENLVNHRIRMITSSFETQVYYKLETFSIKKNTSENILILTDSCVLSYIHGTTFVNFIEDFNNFFFSNHKNYFSFQEFLKTQEKEFDGSFHFVDSYNIDLRKLVFVSIAEKGRLTIKYKQGVPPFDNSKDYSIGFKMFQECFQLEDKSLVKFLKTATIQCLENFPENQRFQTFFESLEEIVNKAKMNFEVYLNGLSIDKFKKDYDDLKTKYYSNLSDVLSKLNTYILALPVGITTLLFAIQEIKQNPSFLAVISILIALTTLFLILLLKSYLADIQNVSDLIKFDFKLLEENNFFVKFPSELVHFNIVKTRVNERIKLMKIIIISYYWIMNLSNVFIIYTCLFDKFSKDISITYFVLVSFIIILVFKTYLIPNEKE